MCENPTLTLPLRKGEGIPHPVLPLKTRGRKLETHPNPPFQKKGGNINID